MSDEKLRFWVVSIDRNLSARVLRSVAADTKTTASQKTSVVQGLYNARKSQIT